MARFPRMLRAAQRDSFQDDETHERGCQSGTPDTERTASELGGSAKFTEREFINLLQELSVADGLIIGASTRVQQECLFGRLPDLCGMEGAVIPPSGKHSATVIFLHGICDTGPGWVGPLSSLRLPHIKFLLPTAPARNLTVSYGLAKAMPCWADLRSFKLLEKEDSASYLMSTAKIQRLIVSEIQNGISPERIVIGGFSQGGAVALTALLRCGLTLGGAFILSSWLPMAYKYPSEHVKGSKCKEVLLCLGNKDRKVRNSLALDSFTVLKELGIPNKQLFYENLAHNISEDELRDVRSFLQRTIPQVIV
eukprot:Plantae.Rhodophyta-Purpureofilum_apyrenoidigerum.ctg37980.p1 GENE.Plantae.Rhodophyta-Purpureofilum_apyrenoidigerum.ctg37980~~Plantae.Rhodophyta-Purpureofilum_apyrenoidigerum.ctg37980.p1  ORF type:complete len:309 (-),score=44.90 Plantae.Rhodophyta-Purpureofilum_apyrenoidigerum.ctg37980:131-1057(-)